jgi:hypothetical protein
VHNKGGFYARAFMDRRGLHRYGRAVPRQKLPTSIEEWAERHPEAKTGTVGPINLFFDGDVLVSRFGDVALPAHFAIPLDVYEWPAIVELEIRVEEGKPRCVRWELRERDRGPALSTSTIRIPFGRAMKIALKAAAFDPNDPSGPFSLLMPGTPMAPQQAVAQEIKRTRGRPRTPTEKRVEVLELWDSLAGQPRRADLVADATGLSRTKVYDILRERKEK